MKGESDLIEQRRQKLERIRQLGLDPYPHRFARSHSVAELVAAYREHSLAQLEAEAVEARTAGRLVGLRGHGKVGFGHIQEGGERLQIYVRRDRVGEENYQLFRLLDVGDLIGVEGVLLRTRTGELTLFANRVHFLAKSLRTLPEKWHGLADVELRYRQRYLDLVVNPGVRRVFMRRSRIISELRSFMESKGYVEVETPMMHPIAGGAAARPFKTYHEALGIELYLRIAPELYLKRLIVGGLEKVYEINRNFRNEGISTQHNPEFTMLEFYQAYSNYEDLMRLTEEMMKNVVERACGSLEVPWGETTIDFGSFRRFSMLEAIVHYWKGAPPRPEELCDKARVVTLLHDLGRVPDSGLPWGKLLGELFEAVVEPELIQPTLIHDFPTELSPLSKRKPGDPRFVERFELFVGGLEIANAYSELNDPEEQERRFRQQLEARARGDQEAHRMDEDYLRALSYGMPPAAGEGIGIDRLVMVLTNSSSIRDVILFPQMRPEKPGSPEEGN